MAGEAIIAFDTARKFPEREAGAQLRSRVSVVCCDALPRPSNWGVGGAWRGWMSLLSAVCVCAGVCMRVGAVFIMHVRQLQVRAATPIPFVALRSTAPSARVSESGNCWGVGAGGRGGRDGHYGGRRRPPAIWTELPFITEELIPAYREKWRQTL